MKETIEGRMRPIAKAERTLSKPLDWTLIIVSATLLYSFPAALLLAVDFGQWLGSLL